MAGSLSESELRQFTGDLRRYRHTVNRGVVYTPGVRFVAERGGAYWLIDEIALALGSAVLRRAIARDDRIQHLHFWRLAVHDDRSARIFARADSGVPPFIDRVVPFTDFPLPIVDIWAAQSAPYWTLYLPSEH